MRAVNPPPTTMQGLTNHRLSQAAWLLMLLVHMTPASAQAIDDEASSTRACKADEVIRFRGGTARLENDRFTGTDQNYTNGVAFTAFSHDIIG